MKTRNLILLGAAFFMTGAVQIEGANAFLVRADFKNISGSQAVQEKNPGVLVSIQGSVQPLASSPTDGAHVLTEVSFAEPFSPYIPYAGFSAGVAADARRALYPSPGSNRAMVLTNTAAFRYKWLLFSPSPGETDVTSHFQQMDSWFGPTERGLADQEIAKLRDALAASPLDTQLRDLLLDCYYDLAVAEMQFAKQRLASLAAKHLGLTVTSPFVIDDEIRIYEELIKLESDVLDKYSELLARTLDGVEPSDFDGREGSGKPMGLYTFLRQQPNRNAIATEYATESGTEFIPDYDETTGTAKIRGPDNLVLFSGYKDFVTVLQVMAQFIQHNAELGRLRGMRQAPGDLTLARRAFSDIMSRTVTDYHLLRALIPKQFAPGDASGVNGAMTGIETSLADVVNVRAFINGTANVLGLDPNFLLLVQGANLPGGYNNESFDVIFGLLKGANQPLSDALNKLSTATTEYQNFRGSVDRVVAELADVDDTHEERFLQITGYEVDEVPGFQGKAKPGITSELWVAQQTLDSVMDRSRTLAQRDQNLLEDIARADQAVTIAEGLNSKVDQAAWTYQDRTGSAYDDLIAWNTASASAQSAAEAIYSIASMDLTAVVKGGPGVASIAGIVNTAIQAAAAHETTSRARDLDYAAIGFESELQKADNALTVNQARQQVGQIRRDQFAHTLEKTDNLLALAQAQSQIATLLNEVKRISANQESDSALIRKSYYADPIHYVRSENALILADSAFRNAQRWIFYAQRSLEYKWQQAFSRSELSAQGVRNFDSGTIFKLRNAAELDDLLTQLKAWNDDRLAQDIRNDRTTFISLKNNVLAKNPYALNASPALRVDAGMRADLQTGNLVTQQELFRRELIRSMDGAGNIVIPINTVDLADLNGTFFVGPNYSGQTVAPGEWRDKIVYLKVNIVAEDGSSIPQTKAGSLSYGGQMFFRTRIPPCVDRTVIPNNLDLPGEYFTAPFRFFFSPKFDNLFIAQDSQTQNVPMAYTASTAVSPTGEEILGSTFQVNAFNQRSVATTRLVLTIFAGQVDPSKIKDIELIVRHQSSARVSICN
jgi:hypothetical protein